MDHSNHVCTKTCLKAHVIGCDKCVMTGDGWPWLCKEGAKISQAAAKAKWAGIAS